MTPAKQPFYRPQTLDTGSDTVAAFVCIGQRLERYRDDEIFRHEVSARGPLERRRDIACALSPEDGHLIPEEVILFGTVAWHQDRAM